MDKITVSDARHVQAVGKQVRLQGWVRTRRDSKGGFSFIELNDGSCQGNVQIVVPGELANYESEVKKLPTGASVVVEGEVKASPAKGQATEVHATRVEVVGGADRNIIRCRRKATRSNFFAPLPICGRAPTPSAPSPGCATRSASRSTTSFRNRASSTFTRRSSRPATAKGPGSCFASRPSTRTKPPKAEGGGVDYTKDFFHKPAFLTVSGQFQVEVFACSMGKVYTFGPTFRAENSNTPRHLAEFWMIEPEMAFYDLQDNMTWPKHS